MQYRTTHRHSAMATCLAMFVLAGSLAGAAAPGPLYHSPYDLAFSPDGTLIAVSDRTEGAIAILDPTSRVMPGGRSVRKATGFLAPGAVAWAADGSKLYVSEYGRATVVELRAGDCRALRTFKTGPHPAGIALAARRQLLLVANSALADVSVVDLNTGNETAKIKVLREPFHISIAPDESLAVVSNLLPCGPATDPQLTASVSIIDLNAMRKLADVPMPPNTTCIRQTAISPDGAWAYAVHTVGRTTLPATQLDRGWVNTNAFSIIDLKKRELYATVLLDNLAEGAADPWGLALSKDGATAYITIAGAHQLGTLNVADLHRLLAGQPPAKPSSKAPASPTIWTEIKADPAKRAGLVNDLSALYIADLLVRSRLPGNGPRGVSLAPDGKQVAVGQYFTGDVLLIDAATARVASTISLGPQSDPTSARRGESIFHDAHYAFQHWLSCATCHPNHARTDGLNWDLPNDGIGNPKSAKSLLQAHLTPPAMWRGVRDTMETASTAGFRFAMRLPDPQAVLDVQNYLRALEPEPSPYLVNGQLSEKARRGKAIFDDEKTRCATCHAGPQYTNLKVYNVGTRGEFDPADHTDFDTPTLIELWRTAPYLHDGRAFTLQEVFAKHNPKDEHGVTSHLSQEQLDDLVEYLLSL